MGDVSMEENPVPQSLIEQILAQMFAMLTEQEVFDAATIQRLKQLAKAGHLAKPSRVTNAIMATEEGVS